MAATKKQASVGKILTVFNQKGGCSKTMTSMQLGGTLGLHGVKTLIVDMDPQNTAALWYHEAGDQPFPAEVMAMAPLKEHFVDKLEALTKKFDLVIIDCPPAIESSIPWISLLVADLAIIPVVPLLDNIWASKAAEELAQKALAHNPTLETCYLVSNYRRGKVYDACLQRLQSTARLGFFDTRITNKNAYPECQVFGCVVSAFGKSAAADEMEALAQEVASKLNIKI